MTDLPLPITSDPEEVSHLEDQLALTDGGVYDNAIRSHFDKTAFEPTAFPCPGGV